MTSLAFLFPDTRQNGGMEELGEEILRSRRSEYHVDQALLEAQAALHVYTLRHYDLGTANAQCVLADIHLLDS